MASSPWGQHPIFSRDQRPSVRKTYSSNNEIYIYINGCNGAALILTSKGLQYVSLYMICLCYDVSHSTPLRGKVGNDFCPASSRSHRGASTQPGSSPSTWLFAHHPCLQLCLLMTMQANPPRLQRCLFLV